MEATLKTLLSSNSQEWYTPPEYIEAVRQVLGHIGLDPASNDEANGIVRAHKYFDQEADGLNREWDALTVFCNPPYGKIGSQSSQGVWLNKMIAEHKAGNFYQGILLINFVPGYKWFRPVWEYPICSVDRCITFIPGAGTENPKSGGKAKASSVFVYFPPLSQPSLQSDAIRLFYDVFKVFGSCGMLLRPWNSQFQAGV